MCSYKDIPSIKPYQLLIIIFFCFSIQWHNVVFASQTFFSRIQLPIVSGLVHQTLFQKAILFGAPLVSRSSIPTGLLENPTMQWVMKIVQRCTWALGFGTMHCVQTRIKLWCVNFCLPELSWLQLYIDCLFTWICVKASVTRK